MSLHGFVAYMYIHSETETTACKPTTPLPPQFPPKYDLLASVQSESLFNQEGRLNIKKVPLLFLQEPHLIPCL